VKTWTVVGLMSGTSTDGIDAAVVRLLPHASRYTVQSSHFRTYPFAPALRRQLLAAAEGGPTPAAAFSRLNAALGEALAGAALRILADARVAPSRVDLIGSHGHTIFHGPPGAVEGLPSTWQIGEPCVIAARTGVTTVADFRPADIAHGGQGAPLVPYVHWLLFRHPRRGRVINNIGGIAHPTFLPARGGIDDIVAFDAGPGNMIIDAVTARLTNGRLRYDRDGALARRGRIDPTLLRELMRHPFLRRRPPKSTGREEFGAPVVDRLLAQARRRRLGDADIVATATAFTARALGDAYRRFLLPRGRIDEVYFCGGGSRNPALMDMLRQELSFARVGVIDELGINGDALEAVAFAVLALETARGRPTNVPAVTGATAAILGKIVPGSAEHFRRLLVRLR
jgi:anhydro-N-acetylmuramic acid kinase